jgi:hypothetical protein
MSAERNEKGAKKFVVTPQGVIFVGSPAFTRVEQSDRPWNFWVVAKGTGSAGRLVDPPEGGTPNGPAASRRNRFTLHESRCTLFFPCPRLPVLLYYLQEDAAE